MPGHFRFQISDFRFGTTNPKSQIPNPKFCPLSPVPRPLSPRCRRAFTLTELMIVIMIIGIMAGLALSAISAAAELAREQRTRAIIAKLDQLIMEKYEGYRTRAVPLSRTRRQTAMSNANAPRIASQERLGGIRELMKLELPDRITDLCNPGELIDLNADGKLDGINGLPLPTVLISSAPAVTRSYKRKARLALVGSASTGWTPQYQGSECLYLIISSMHDGDKQATDYFAPEEIGDLDSDGMKEILDGWGQPIEFLRWAPGYVTNPWDATTRVAMLTTQTRPALDPATGAVVVYTPDIFDPARADPRVLPADTVGLENDPFELRPLLISGGRDRLIDIILDDYDPTNPAAPMDPTSWRPLVYRATTVVLNDPYVILPTASQPGPFRRIGEPVPLSVSAGYADNLTNHFQETP